MKKNILKIAFCLIVILSILLISTVSATSIIEDIDNNKGTNTSAGNTVKETGNIIIGTIKVVGTGIAILMLLYIAIKYMIAAPSEKAEFKKTAVVYAVGAVVLFAAPRLVELVMRVTQGVSNTLN